jgi:2-dehydro-3-deoxyphosphogluconate aldolase/(4S)-4-hydroxy-2-oxoglutarate aldolase
LASPAFLAATAYGKSYRITNAWAWDSWLLISPRAGTLKSRIWREYERMTPVHWIEQSGIVAVIRLDDLSSATTLAEALIAGGIQNLEFTYTNREAGKAIEQVRASAGDRAHVGAGSVLDAETARQAILAGAEFVVTPTLRLQTIEICRRYSVPSVIGAFSPTEILTAWEAGADYIKVNPASVAGPG